MVNENNLWARRTQITDGLKNFLDNELGDPIALRDLAVKLKTSYPIIRERLMLMISEGHAPNAKVMRLGQSLVVMKKQVV